MAEHDVSFTLPERQLGRADIEFRIKRNRRAFGRLRVSEGSLVWVPADRTLGFKLGWVDFDRLAQEHGERGHR